MSKSKQSAASDVMDCQWVDIKDLVDRADVLLLDEQLVLKEVAAALSSDNVTQVKRWLDNGELQKLSDFDNVSEQFSPGDCFQLIIVSPFALIKRR